MAHVTVHDDPPPPYEPPTYAYAASAPAGNDFHPAATGDAPASVPAPPHAMTADPAAPNIDAATPAASATAQSPFEVQPEAEYEEWRAKRCCGARSCCPCCNCTNGAYENSQGLLCSLMVVLPPQLVWFLICTLGVPSEEFAGTAAAGRRYGSNWAGHFGSRALVCFRLP